MIVCQCREKSERAVEAAIDKGAGSLRDLMRCGIGDQCGSCHNALRGMLARAEFAGACGGCGPAVVEPTAASLSPSS